MIPNSEEMLKKVDGILKEEGIEFDEELNDPQVILREFILPGLKNSKDTLSTIYGYQQRPRGGLFGKIKTMIQNKIIYTIIGVIEKQSMKQQKFNELAYRAIEILIEESGTRSDK